MAVRNSARLSISDPSSAPSRIASTSAERLLVVTPDTPRRTKSATLRAGVTISPAASASRRVTALARAASSVCVSTVENGFESRMLLNNATSLEVLTLLSESAASSDAVRESPRSARPLARRESLL